MPATTYPRVCENLEEFKANLKSYTTLNLSNKNLTTGDVNNLVEFLQRNKDIPLDTLNLSGNSQIGLDGVKKIFIFLSANKAENSNKTLRKVDLSNCGIDFPNTEAVIDLSNNNTLIKLNLEGNTGFSKKKEYIEAQKIIEANDMAHEICLNKLADFDGSEKSQKKLVAFEFDKRRYNSGIEMYKNQPDFYKNELSTKDGEGYKHWIEDHLDDAIKKLDALTARKVEEAKRTEEEVKQPEELKKTEEKNSSLLSRFFSFINKFSFFKSKNKTSAMSQDKTDSKKVGKITAQTNDVSEAKNKSEKKKKPSKKTQEKAKQVGLEIKNAGAISNGNSISNRLSYSEKIKQNTGKKSASRVV